MVATGSQKKLIFRAWLLLLIAFVDYSTYVVGRVIFFENLDFIKLRHSGIVLYSYLLILVNLLLIVSFIIEDLCVVTLEKLLNILDVFKNKTLFVDLIVVQKTVAIIL